MKPLIWRMGCTLGGGGGQEQTGEMQPLIWRRRGCTLGGGGGGLSGVKLVQQLTGGLHPSLATGPIDGKEAVLLTF